MSKNFGVLVISSAVFGAFLCSCAQLHHVQISDIDNTKPNLKKVEVKASETGLDVGEAMQITKAIGRNSRKVQNNSSAISNIWDLITYGPRTGNVVFDDDYADELAGQLENSCPSKKVTGVMSIRESNKYPVISGEIVRLVGYCAP